MDVEDETTKMKAVLVIGLITLVSGCMSWGEVRYLIWGKTCEAHIVNQYEVRTRSRNASPHTAIVYQYDDNGEKRQDSDQMPLGWAPDEGTGNTVRVEYIPGKDYASRIAGHSQRWIAWVFLACCLVIASLIGWIVYEGKAATLRPRTSDRLSRTHSRR